MLSSLFLTEENYHADQGNDLGECPPMIGSKVTIEYRMTATKVDVKDQAEAKETKHK